MWVEIYDAVEVKGDLKKKLRARSKESLESVEDDGEVFKLWGKDAKNLGHQ